MEVESKNNLRYVSINQIYSSLCPLVCSAFPAFHAFFGCDYTAAFTEIDDEAKDIETFICTLYGQKQLTAINDARFQIFCKKFKKKNDYQLIAQAKTFDGSCMPPCRRVLVEKIKRAKFVGRKWMTSPGAFQLSWCPTDF